MNILTFCFGIFVGIIIGIFILIIKIEPNFIKLSMTDWFTSISSIVVAIFTVKLALIAKETSDSWKEQKKPEAVRDVIGYFISFSQYAFIMSRNENISKEDFIKLKDAFEKIEPAIIYFFSF